MAGGDDSTMMMMVLSSGCGFFVLVLGVGLLLWFMNKKDDPTCDDPQQYEKCANPTGKSCFKGTKDDTKTMCCPLPWSSKDKCYAPVAAPAGPTPAGGAANTTNTAANPSGDTSVQIPEPAAAKTYHCPVVYDSESDRKQNTKKQFKSVNVKPEFNYPGKCCKPDTDQAIGANCYIPVEEIKVPRLYDREFFKGVFLDLPDTTKGTSGQWNLWDYPYNGNKKTTAPNYTGWLNKAESMIVPHGWTVELYTYSGDLKPVSFKGPQFVDRLDKSKEPDSIKFAKTV